jgi:hypothetical protein
MMLLLISNEQENEVTFRGELEGMVVTGETELKQSPAFISARDCCFI